MKRLLALINIFLSLALSGQTITTIYCFPGQGSDKRIFDSLDIDKKYQIKVIEYGTPDKGMTMASFARKLSTQIDTSQQFILLGVSLGA